MGSYIVATNALPSKGEPFTVFYSHDAPLDGGVAQYLCSLLYAVDRFEAANKCIASLGGYGTIIAVLHGHHIPILRSGITHIWDQKQPYDTKEILVTTIDMKQTNPAKLIPNKPTKRKRVKKNG